MRALKLALLLACLLAASTGAAAQLARDTPLEVRILYDNSGSMYPGYRPPGAAERRGREALGVHYVHQSPAFARWLHDFVQRQSVMGAANVGMWTFTSNAQFTPEDIHAVHPVVPLRDFDAAAAVRAFPERAGNNTYLTETLTTFSRGFTGLIWLITDNIVEANAGEPDAGVQRFFETLAQTSEIRSVHLFKDPVEEAGQTTALAVYGILVSPADVPDETLATYDGRFRTLRDAKGADGADLFPGRSYLKLKNLAIEPMHLSADLQLLLADRDKGTFREGQNVALELDGEIRSYLTQHSVTGGHYELSIASPFVPEERARRDLGAQPLAPEVFGSDGGDVQEVIPPNGTRRVHASLGSNQTVSFHPSNPIAWLRLAWSGAVVRYSGIVRMSFSDVKVRLEPEQMGGIFGMDHAAAVFDFQNVTTIPDVRPSSVPVSFELRTGSSRTAILLALLAIAGVVVTAGAFVLSRKQVFRITVSHGPETVTALRRLGSYDVMFDGKLLGRLSRGLTSGYAFHPVNGSRELSVVPAGDDTWDVKSAEGPSRRLSIRSEGGGAKKQGKAQLPSARAADPSPPPPPARGLAPPGPPPRIGRR